MALYPTELRDVLDLVDKLVLPVIGYGAYVLRDIRNHLRLLNGRLGRAEQWTTDHDSRDAERFDSLSNDVRELRSFHARDLNTKKGGV